MKQDSFSKKYIKSHLSTAYSVARSIRNTIKDEKIKKLSKKEDVAIHATDVSVDTPIKKLYVEPAIKRLNIIIPKMSQDINEKEKELLILATKLANDKKYALRIISRNSIPNPKVYNDLLSTYNIKMPKNLSFYTDWHERISSSIYALEMTSGDVFFTNIEKLEEWRKR